MDTLRLLVFFALSSVLIPLRAVAAEVPRLAPPQVPPDGDPPAHRVVALVPAVAHQHPRLLFSAQDILAMKQFAETEGKPFFDQLLGYLPSCHAPEQDEFLTNATDGIRQGMWRMPTVGLHYLLTGDRKSLEAGAAFLDKFCSLDHWELGDEADAGMSSANIMAGVALLYDWLYNDLDPAQRERTRGKLLLMARRQFYFGHLMLSRATHYWQSDPQNNHRWHRDAGLALAVLGIAGDGPEDEWMLEQTADELKFIHDWLPEDGTCHESPGYMAFGGPCLTVAMQAADRCLGTHYLDHPFFRNAPLFRMHTLVPGMKDSFPYGDAGGSGFMNNYFYQFTGHHHLKDLQAGLVEFQKADDYAFQYGWTSLVWFHPDVTGGSLDNLKKVALFPDLGLAFMRDDWRQGVGAMFKCGPYGGHKLNQYRNERALHYINVAHDDPDANMFVIFNDGQPLADDDRYSAHKETSSHNTILVNGKGQKGSEGGEWTQPLAGVDMDPLARIVSYKSDREVTIAEGEAGAMYDGLSRYRRSFIWVGGRYILVLDDIRADRPAEITWLVQGPQVEAVNAAAGAYRITKGDARLDFQIAADADSAVIADSTADSGGKPLGYRQLQLTKRASHWRLASVFDPWHRGLRVEFKPAGEEQANVTVSGPGFTDAWQWTAAPDQNTPSTISARGSGGFTASLGPKDTAPTGGEPAT